MSGSLGKQEFEEIVTFPCRTTSTST